MQTNSRGRALPSAVIGFALLAALAGRSTALETVDGQQLYLKYCSSCHGAGGKGDGVVSRAMRPHPSDLTRLAQKSGGSFASDKVAGRIDGRELDRFHGEPDMPIWGEVLRQPNAEAKGAEQAATSKILRIVEYLKAIQQK